MYVAGGPSAAETTNTRYRHSWVT